MPWRTSTSGCGGSAARYKAEWTQDDAEAELAKALLQIKPETPKRAGITLAQAVERYLAAKSRKRSVSEDRRILRHLKDYFGKDTLLAEITASRISEYKGRRLSTVRKIAQGETATDRPLAGATVNRALALLRHAALGSFPFGRGERRRTGAAAALPLPRFAPHLRVLGRSTRRKSPGSEGPARSPLACHDSPLRAPRT